MRGRDRSIAPGPNPTSGRRPGLALFPLKEGRRLTEARFAGEPIAVSQLRQIHGLGPAQTSRPVREIAGRDGPEPVRMVRSGLRAARAQIAPQQCKVGVGIPRLAATR